MVKVKISLQDMHVSQCNVPWSDVYMVSVCETNQSESSVRPWDTSEDLQNLPANEYRWVYRYILLSAKHCGSAQYPGTWQESTPPPPAQSMLGEMVYSGISCSHWGGGTRGSSASCRTSGREPGIQIYLSNSSRQAVGYAQYITAKGRGSARRRQFAFQPNCIQFISDAEGYWLVVKSNYNSTRGIRSVYHG